MKLAYADYTDLSSGVIEEFDYKIKASPTMFYIMVSALAKDKIGYLRRDNQDDEPATIRMTLRRAGAPKGGRSPS